MRLRALCVSFLIVAASLPCLAQVAGGGIAVRQKGQFALVPEIGSVERAGASRRLLDDVFAEDFEGGYYSWSLSGSWGIGGPTSGPSSGHLSPRCAATNLTGNYANNANDGLISPAITLPALSHPAARIHLSFWEWYQTESGYDYGYLQISANNGTTWTEISRRDGSATTWRETDADLTAYANRTIRLGFLLTSDASITAPGWYVDDLRLIAEEPEPLTATLVSLDSRSFEYLHASVAVDTFGVGIGSLTEESFQVRENGALQTDHFEIVPPGSSGGVRRADIIIVLDVSSSMQGEINAVKSHISRFINALANSLVDFRVGFVVYANCCHVYNDGALYSNANQIVSIVNGFSIDEHGTACSNSKDPESGFDALAAATTMNFRPGAQKVAILVTDAPCHYANDTQDYPDQDEGVHTSYTLQSIVQRLQSVPMTCYVAGPDLATDCGLGWRYGDFIAHYPNYGGQYWGAGSLPEETNGSYYVVTGDFSGIVDHIAESIGNVYVVNYRASNPHCDGTQRNVVITVSYRTWSDEAGAGYVPCSQPVIHRTAATEALHDRPWGEGTAFTIDVEITDNASPYVQSAALYYRRTTDANYHLAAMVRQTGNIYRGAVPGSAVLRNGLDYYLTATDGQSTSSAPSTDPQNRPFQLAILPNIAPQILHASNCQFTAGNDYDVSAEISDVTNQVQWAKVFYRRIGQLNYEEGPLTAATGNQYAGRVPSAFVVSDGFEYYLEAKDDLGVSGCFGSPDAPIAMGDPMRYVRDKRATIGYFAGLNFYRAAEQDALDFTDDMESRIQNGTVSCRDIEALRRLLLVEDAARTAYPGADELATLSGKATMQLAITVFFEVGLGKIVEWLRPFKNWPVVGGIYRKMDGALTSFRRFTQSFRLQFVTQLGNRMVPYLRELGFTTSEARSIAFEKAHAIFRIGLEALQRRANQQLESVDSQSFVKGLYRNLYENGLGVGDVFHLGGTKSVIERAVEAAQDQSFQEGDIDNLTQSVRSGKVPAMVADNQTSIQEINHRFDWAELLSKIALATTIIVAIAGVIAGLIACGFTGGVGCILSALSAVVGWSGLSTLLTFFTVAKIGLYAWGMGIGLFRLEAALPGDLNEIQRMAFDQTTLQAPALQDRAGWEGDSPLAALPVRWTDSLTGQCSQTAQQVTLLRDAVQQRDWNRVDSLQLGAQGGLEKLGEFENLTNAILRVAYTYHDVPAPAQVDSVFNYTVAYSAAGEIGLAFSQLSLAFALASHPSGAQTDTLAGILNETASRLYAWGPAYRRAFDQYTAWGVQVPAMVAFVSFGAEKMEGGAIVEARMKNIASASVHDVVCRLSATDSVHAIIVPVTADQFPVLNAEEEQWLQWQVRYSGSDSLLFLQLEVAPGGQPGDFEGDTQMLSVSVVAAASPAPAVSGYLANANVYAYPNPFNPEKDGVATFRYQLRESGSVTVKIYDASQRLVSEQNLGMQPAKAELSAVWDGRNQDRAFAANGVYFYVIESNLGEKGVGKLAVLR